MLYADSTTTFAKLPIGINGKVLTVVAGIPAWNTGGQSAIQFKDEGSNLGAAGTADTVNYTGAGQTASRVGNVVTVDVPGGGSAGVGAQIGYVRTTSTTSASTTDTSIPLDNTIPQNTEGVAYASLDTTYTPAEAASLLEIMVYIPLTSASGASSHRYALFRDSTADAIAAHVAMTISANGYAGVLYMVARVPANAATATTFKLRWSTDSGTGRIMNIATLQYFGSANYAQMIVREIKQ